MGLACGRTLGRWALGSRCSKLQVKPALRNCVSGH